MSDTLRRPDGSGAEGRGRTLRDSPPPASYLRRLMLATLAAGMLVGGLACGKGASQEPTGAEGEPVANEPAGPSLFEDVTAGSGIDFTYRNGEEADHYAILESLGGGVALLDYDGDGLLDVFLTGGGYYAGPESKEIRGHPGKLYRNLGG
ncbi:MAG TPA: hypothetical protein VIL46_03205, partial [Gemmataceae bacterium]